LIRVIQILNQGTLISNLLYVTFVPIIFMMIWLRDKLLKWLLLY